MLNFLILLFGFLTLVLVIIYLTITIFRKRKNKKSEPLKIDNSKNKDLQLAFETQDGTKFYIWKDFSHIPAIRSIAGERATRFATLKISEPLLKDAIKKCKEFLNRNKMADAIGVIMEIELRLNLYGEEETFLELANCYILLQDEDPIKITSYHSNKKKEIAANDTNVRAFFLNTAFSFIKKFSNFSEKDFLKYLDETQAIADRLISSLHEKS